MDTLVTSISPLNQSGTAALGGRKGSLGAGASLADGSVGEPSNPALRLGRFNRAQAEDRKVEFLTREEAERFLEAARELKPERYALFLTGLRTGLRLGELVALEWEDIQFGGSEDDKNRYILVQHNIVRGQATSPKSRKPRRVDLSKELRRVLMELRDQRILDAIEEHGQFDDHGEPKIAKLAFPSEAGGPLDSRNVYHRDFLPCLKATGLRRVTFHALRHTFASLLIQSGASLTYVKEQMGHSSIQVTADVYGHLVPGGNIEWVDRLDRPTSPQQNATPAQPGEHAACGGSLQVVEKAGRRGGTRTHDPRIRNPMLYPTELHARNSG
jgi:integrase